MTLLGCDPTGRERAAMEAELAARSAENRAQQEQIAALTAELDQLRGELRARERALELVITPPPAAPTGEPPAPTGEPALTPVCEAGVCTVQRAEFEALLDTPATAARMARIIPALENGKTVGFKLFAILNGSPLALLGFKNGDLVRAINGSPLGDIEQAMRVFSQAKKTERWTIAGTRKDAPFELTIAVK